MSNLHSVPTGAPWTLSGGAPSKGAAFIFLAIILGAICLIFRGMGTELSLEILQTKSGLIIAGIILFLLILMAGLISSLVYASNHKKNELIHRPMRGLPMRGLGLMAFSLPLGFLFFIHGQEQDPFTVWMVRIAALLFLIGLGYAGWLLIRDVIRAIRFGTSEIVLSPNRPRPGDDITFRLKKHGLSDYKGPIEVSLQNVKETIKVMGRGKRRKRYIVRNFLYQKTWELPFYQLEEDGITTSIPSEGIAITEYNGQLPTYWEVFIRVEDLGFEARYLIPIH